jgi:hypothetical protein
VPTRLIITYPLILLLIVGAAAPPLEWSMYHSRRRTYARERARRKKAEAAHAAKLQKGAGDG